MLRKFIRLFYLLSFLFLAGCSAANEQDAKFDEKTASGIEIHAKEYDLRTYELGKVPLHAYVKFSGKILKKDTNGRVINKDDRFIVSRKGVKVQVISQVNTNCHVGDEITVYGEYYGFIQGLKITRSKSNH